MAKFHPTMDVIRLLFLFALIDVKKKLIDMMTSSLPSSSAFSSSLKVHWLQYSNTTIIIILKTHNALITILKHHHHLHPKLKFTILQNHHHNYHRHHHNNNSKRTDYNPPIWLNQLTPRRLSVWSTHTWRLSPLWYLSMSLPSWFGVPIRTLIIGHLIPNSR